MADTYLNSAADWNGKQSSTSGDIADSSATEFIGTDEDTGFPAIAAEEAAETTIEPALTPTGTFSHHVLIAEDNAINRMLISKMLEKYGCSYTLVTNGREAVEAVTHPAGHDFDIILMDIQMPEMDGREAARAIRVFENSHAAIPRVPIVALTANGLPEEVTQYLAAGMDTHLLKPIDWPRLMATIDAIALHQTPSGASTSAVPFRLMPP